VQLGGERQSFSQGLNSTLFCFSLATHGLGDCLSLLSSQEVIMTSLFRRLWKEQKGQDIAEYAVMLALILVLVVGTIRLVGSNANNVFSSVASSVQ
jgi:Flp pilus assembly pilin Flp